MDLRLIESILTKNPCYTAGRKITVKGLMLHSVGCPQPRASVFIHSWNSASFDRACVHGFIDGNDGTVYQTLPWNHRGWHCGSSINGSANNTHIGVEMCEPACITYTGGASFKCSDLATARAVAKRTYEAAVELFAMLCKQYGLDPLADGVIISHKEGHARGIASNHGDPEHLWSQLGMGYTMNTFRKAVKDKLSGTASEEKPQVASGTQAVIFKTLTEEQAVAKIGELCKADSRKSGRDYYLICRNTNRKRHLAVLLDALLFVALSQNGGFVKLNMIQYLKRRFVRNVREVEAFHRNHTDQ